MRCKSTARKAARNHLIRRGNKKNGKSTIKPTATYNKIGQCYAALLLLAGEFTAVIRVALPGSFIIMEPPGGEPGLSYMRLNCAL